MKLHNALAAAVLVLAFVTPAVAKPIVGKKRDPKKLGANALVTWRQLEGKPGRGAATAEEQTAAQIQKLLRTGALRDGQTGLFVVDARTGDPLFSVNPDDPVNPASNVKMISTATALELLGPDFRYPTRLFGAAPESGIVHGDVYLLGSYDPTLRVGDLDDIGRSLVERGVTSVEGDLVIGSDPTREAIFRGVIPITVTAGDPGKPAIASVTAAPSGGYDLVEFKVAATTSSYAHPAHLAYRTVAGKDAKGRARLTVTITGAIGKGDHAEYKLETSERTAAAAYGAIAALRTHGIAFTGDVKLMELGDFVGDAVATGALPVEIARHDSEPVASIVADINKWSINWLADRIVMTAAALTRRHAPSMDLAIDAMYAWLARHPHVERTGVVLDTGSGLSYKTKISPHELVDVVRSAGGFSGDSDPTVAKAWLHSLSIGGTDGTLAHRFLGGDVRGRLIGKTGTLSTVIALSGVLDIDPARPLAFSLVTNSDAPLQQPSVRKAHELVVGELCKYLAKTAKAPVVPVAAPAADRIAAPADEEFEGATP